jgi:hypothetical protein
MLRILLDLYHFSDFLALSAICGLLVRPHRKNVFVLDRNSMPNNREQSLLMEKGLFILCVSSDYCKIESHPLFRNPIQNP